MIANGLEIRDRSCLILVCKRTVYIHKWLNTSYMILYAGRTFPTHCHYVGETKQKLSLFRVLTMYAEFNASVGYCQGS